MAQSVRYKRVATLKKTEAFAAYLEQLGIDLPFDQEVVGGTDSPLGQSLEVQGRIVGNRFAILPMEGWDGEANGKPSELTLRRWERFGASGAKLIWGAEATAVRHDGRANPNQLVISEENEDGLAALREKLLNSHRERYGTTDDLLLGLQLTHSGRFCRPNAKDRLEPMILYYHPLLAQKYALPTDYPVMTDEQIDTLIVDFVVAAKRAQKLGFDFVDVKHCHGYLGHEFLSAVTRPGRYGGSFENRTRFLREIVGGIRREAPGLQIGVRLSAFDMLAYMAGENNVGRPMDYEGEYRYGFGINLEDPENPDLTEPIRFLELLRELDIRLVCLTAGSPYYNPHIQRPAIFPPSDGYLPPEDPLVGVARQLKITARLKQHFPDLVMVGSGYSYLQEHLPRVGQYNVANGRVDMIGLGRMVLSYPELPADVLAGRPLQTKFICRTFSECTTGPRNGMISGCFPLDPFFKAMPEAKVVKQLSKRVE